KERDLVPFEREQAIAANHAAIAVGLERRIEHLRLELDDFVAPAPVGNPELQRLYSRIGGDDGVAAEDDGGGRPRKARKEQAGGQRLIHQADERFNRDDHVGGKSVRTHLTVANRCKRLNAEEESLAEAAAEHLAAGTGKCAWTARQEH